MEVSVSARMLDGQIELLIRNNGEAVLPERMVELNERFKNGPVSVKSHGMRIGLNNINSRLKLFYGESHYIRVDCDGEITTFRFLVERRPDRVEETLV